MQHKKIDLSNSPLHSAHPFYLTDEKNVRLEEMFDTADQAHDAAVELVKANPLKTYVISTWAGSVHAQGGTIYDHRYMPMPMPKINVHRYGPGEGGHYLGFVEPEDKKWILFIGENGAPQLFSKRDPVSGAVIESIPARAL